MNNRYTFRREVGSDWEVLDTKTGIAVATGLDEDEARETALHRNAEEARKCDQ